MCTVDSFETVGASISAQILCPNSKVRDLSPKTPRGGTWDRLKV